jgi:hypothetical protein
MKPDPRFIGQGLEFWAYVRALSQHLGYTKKTKKADKEPPSIAAHTLSELKTALQALGFSSIQLETPDGQASMFGQKLEAYFAYRAAACNRTIQNNLMNLEEAEHIFNRLKNDLNPMCPLPVNKQSDEKKIYAYFTGIINMILEQHIGSDKIDYEPQKLVTITRNNAPLRTFSRRVDGCFPGTTDPKAIWEIKEYYHTTSFGSRIADGVYETMLDGLERHELQQNHGIQIHHTLFIDARYTWWDKGKSYLCRLVDLLHMGYLSELIVGREVLERLPEIVQDWKRL